MFDLIKAARVLPAVFLCFGAMATLEGRNHKFLAKLMEKAGSHREILNKHKELIKNRIEEQSFESVAPCKGFKVAWKPLDVLARCLGPAQGTNYTISKIGVSFLACTSTDTPSNPAGGTPPDTMGAIGPKQYVMCINNGIKSFNRKTGAPDGVLDTTLECILGFCGNDVVDPKIRFDSFSGCWFIGAIRLERNAFELSTYVLAVALTQETGGVITPCTKWRTFEFNPNLIPEGNGPNHRDNNVPIGSTNLGIYNAPDFPQIGIDKEALYIALNLYGGSGVRVDLYVIQKASAIEGNDLVVNAFRNLGGDDVDFSEGVILDAFGTYGLTGVDNFDCHQDFGYAIGLSANTPDQLVLYRVENPGHSNPIVSDAIYIPVESFSTLGGAAAEVVFGNQYVPNKGNFFNTGPLWNTVVNMTEAHVRNGHLYTSFSYTVDSQGQPSATFDYTIDRQAVRWLDIKNIDSLPSINQCGLVYDPTTGPNPVSYFFESTMTNKYEDFTLSCNAAGADRYVEGVSFRRTKKDDLGSLGPEQIIAKSHFPNPSLNYQLSGGLQRWGDYATTSRDPVGDISMWAIQEFAYDTDVWGLQVV
jgi:hypothetical protein